ncbi:MAG: twin-arginine translocase subunit TatC [Candidatus Brocadiales bacterium]
MSIKGIKSGIEELRLSLGEHLEELRTRIIVCILFLLVCFIVCWVFKADLLWLAKRPHTLTMEKLGLPTTLKVLSYQEGFFAYIKLCLISAFFVSYPFMIFQAWLFVGVGLYPHERKYVKTFLPVSFMAFIVGSLFGYLFLIPLCLYFLINILGTTIIPVITMSQYISLMFLLTIALGLVFQIPLVMLLLSKMGILDADDFITHRRHILLGVFVVAAIITPPDPFSQISTAIPMLALYELGILLIKPTRERIMYAAGVFVAVLLAAGGLYAYLTMTEIGSISSSDGTVTVTGSKDESTNSLCRGNELRTGSDSRTAISLASDTHVFVNQETRLAITGKSSLKLFEGEVLVSVREGGGGFEVVTEGSRVQIAEDEKAGAGEKGIEFDVRVTEGTLVVTVIRGIATVIAEEERHTVRAGRQLAVSPGGKPVDTGTITNWAEGLEVESK